MAYIEINFKRGCIPDHVGDDEEIARMTEKLRKRPIKSTEHRFDRSNGDIVIASDTKKFIQTLRLDLDVGNRFGTGELSA